MSSSNLTTNQAVVPFAAEKIRVGRDYQAVCPELEPVEARKPETINDRALLVWSPTADISDIKCKYLYWNTNNWWLSYNLHCTWLNYLPYILVDEYITTAKEKYGYNGEQALGMLFWHKHDLSRASLDLANFTPFPDEWTVEDKVLFEQAFQFHGKSFHRIRHMVCLASIFLLRIQARCAILWVNVSYSWNLFSPISFSTVAW